MIDFGKTAADYARYRPAFSPRLFDRLGDFGIGTSGQMILDVGAGTGLLGSRFCELGARVTSLDVRLELIQQASHRRIAGRAEAIPFADGSFDVVSAAQCWHWFDRTLAPLEIHRVLRRAGEVAVIYQTYVPLPGTAAEATEQLMLQHRRGWRHANSTGVNGQVLRDLQISGFEAIESFSFDVTIRFTRGSWRGFIRTTSAVGASMSGERLARFEAEHESLLQRFPHELDIPHRVFAVVARKSEARV